MCYSVYWLFVLFLRAETLVITVIYFLFQLKFGCAERWGKPRPAKVKSQSDSNCIIQVCQLAYALNDFGQTKLLKCI